MGVELYVQLRPGVLQALICAFGLCGFGFCWPQA